MARRHSWEKLEIHRYRCKREDCAAVAVKTPDDRGPGYSTVWTFPDGRVFSTAGGGRTPPCGPAEESMEVGERAVACGEGLGDGRICGAAGPRPYPRGPRCDAHAPWSTYHGGPGTLLQGQYCQVPLHKTQTPDVASWAVVDARAIASGKRRSDQETLAAARMTVEEQREGKTAGQRPNNA